MKQTKTHVRVGFALFALFAAPAASRAAVLCVNPAGSGGCHATIQLAVDAAAARDRVMIAAGTYYENVVVPTGKDGLQIQGAGLTTILDAEGDPKVGNTVVQSGIVIGSRDVQVRNLMLRNGRLEGILIDASGVLIQGLTISGPNFAGIAVTPNGWNAQIVQNDIRHTMFAILSAGFATVARSNALYACLTGISIQGDAAQLVGNRVSNSGVGISVQGDGSVVRLNDLRDHSNQAITTDGSNPIIEGNQISNAPFGVLAVCANCFGGSISGNTVTNTVAIGMLVSADSAGMVVRRNVLLRTGEGLLLSGIGITAEANRVSDAGTSYGAPCFAVHGERHTLRGNVASQCASAGFYVNASLTLLERNQATGSFENGFTVDGDNGQGGLVAQNRLVGNRTSLDAGQGFAIMNHALETTLVGNVSSGTRTDLCDEGLGTVLAGNAFATSSVGCVISHSS
jgi:hypothetical protein